MKYPILLNSNRDLQDQSGYLLARQVDVGFGERVVSLINNAERPVAEKRYLPGDVICENGLDDLIVISRSEYEGLKASQISDVEPGMGMGEIAANGNGHAESPVKKKKLTKAERSAIVKAVWARKKETKAVGNK